MAFLRAFAKNPSAVGSLTPSGRALSRAMVSAAGITDGSRVLEVGAGTGVFTDEIAKHFRGSHVLAIEREPALAKQLAGRWPNVHVVEGSAQHAGAFVAERGWSSVDCVVSGLPWALWPQPVQDDILTALTGVLAPEGAFVTFAYLHAWAMPGAIRLRRSLATRFAVVGCEHRVMANLPPAGVLVARQPKR